MASEDLAADFVVGEGSVVVVTSDDPVSTDTDVSNNQPGTRRDLVVKELLRLKGLGAKLDMVIVDKPMDITLESTAGVHEEGLVALFRDGYARWQAALDDMGVSVARDFSPSPLPEMDHLPDGGRDRETRPVLLLVPAQTTPRDQLQRPGNSILGNMCYFAQDRFTPIGPATAEKLGYDLSIVHRAVEFILSGTKEPVYALTTNAGHHSSRSSFGGYCYINQSCVAVSLLKAKYGKVAHVDVDYHAGNGSMSIWWNEPSVLFASIHLTPELEYPFNAGFTDQTGGAEAPGLVMNEPLPGMANWTEHYKPALARVLERVKEFGAEAIVVSLGLDTLVGDPETMVKGGMCLDYPDYTEMGAMFRETGLPLLYVQEGGYFLPKIPHAVGHLFDVSRAAPATA